MARLLRFAIAAATSTAIILLLTFGVPSVHLWPGGHLFDRDIILESFVLFPIIVGLVAAIWPSARLGGSPFAAGTTGAVIGLVYGHCAPIVLWAYLVGAWYWQPFGYIGGVADIAAAVCGVAAGTCAMLLAVTRRSRPVIATVVILILAAVIVPAPTFDLIYQTQELTVAVVTPYSPGPTEGPTATRYDGWTPADAASVTKYVMDLLRNGRITGQYQVSYLNRTGRGKKALEVIVLNQPVVSKVQLKEPRGGDLIYIQLPDGWKKIPPQFPTVGRSLTIEPFPAEDALAGFKVYDAFGSSTEFVVWKTGK